jgi:hypothetical protein
VTVRSSSLPSLHARLEPVTPVRRTPSPLRSPPAGFARLRLNAKRRACKRHQCEAGTSKRPFARPHGPFRCRSAQAGSQLLPYFFDSITPLLRNRSALTSILGLSREPPGTSTAKTRFPLVQRHSRQLRLVRHSPSGFWPFWIKVLDQARPAGGLPSGTPDLPSLPTGPCF